MDKYSAVWVSHSSINDFRSCPRSYYLKNLYRDPRTNHKIALVTPALSLGSAVHEVVESLSVLPVKDRFQESLVTKFKNVWTKYSGEKGGFAGDTEEKRYYEKGEEMIRRVMDHPGPLKELAVKIKGDLPNYWLSEDDGIILCGKLDWLEYQEATDTIKILDFKTGRNEEPPDSLQLPIYYLLATNCQTRRVDGASYWYLARDDMPRAQALPDLDKSKELVLKFAKNIKLARSLDRFKCPEGEGGCKYCNPYERIVKGDAMFVGNDNYDRDLYSLATVPESTLPESEIL